MIHFFAGDIFYPAFPFVIKPTQVFAFFSVCIFTPDGGTYPLFPRTSW